MYDTDDDNRIVDRKSDGDAIDDNYDDENTNNYSRILNNKWRCPNVFRCGYQRCKSFVICSVPHKSLVKPFL